MTGTPGRGPTFGLVYGKRGRVSSLIRQLSAFRGEPPSVINHAFVVRSDGETIVESTPTGTRERSWRATYHDSAHWGVLVEPVGCPDGMRDKLEHELDRYLGMRYGYAAIAKHFLDGLLGRVAGRDVYLFRRLTVPWRVAAPRYNICSWLVCWTHLHAGWRFQGPHGVLPCERVAPDDLWDDVFEHRPSSYRVAAEFGKRPQGLLGKAAQEKLSTDLDRRSA